MKTTSLRRGLFLLLALVTLFLSACAGSENAATETLATEETADAGSALVTAVSPVGETDIVNEKIRAFLELAHERYTPGDTSFTVKKDDELGTYATSTLFSWKIDQSVPVKNVTVQYGEDPTLADCREASTKRTDVTSIPVINLKTGATYYWRVAVTPKEGETIYSEIASFETKPGPRVLSITDVKNARDLGGWTTVDGDVIPCGRVFRSANLDHPGEAAQKYILEELGIKTEIDFRNSTKDAMNPVLTDSLNYVNISIFSYAGFLKDRVGGAKVLRIFTKPENYPVTFHCAGGADRAGTVSFILNALCGVDEIDLVCDYELTAERYRSGANGGTYFNFPELIKAFYLRPGETMRDKARYFCLTECGLSEMEVANIVALRMKDHGVYADPPQKPLAVKGGKIAAQIDMRNSKSIASVTDEAGEALPFTLEDGLLTVTVSGEGTGTITFDDGGTLPILWA